MIVFCIKLAAGTEDFRFRFVFDLGAKTFTDGGPDLNQGSDAARSITGKIGTGDQFVTIPHGNHVPLIRFDQGIAIGFDVVGSMNA